MINIAKKMAVCATLNLVITTGFASSIAVNPLSFFLTPSSRFNDIYVRNTGKSTAYVNITPYRILHPGRKQQKLVKIDFKDPYKFGLLVSSDKLAIRKDGVRSVRVVALPDLKQTTDKVYEVKVMPDQGQWVTIKTQNKNLKAGINVVQGFAVMVVVRPLRPHPNIILQRHGKKLTIKNIGNSYARLYQAKQCIKGKCHQLKDAVFAMYAGLEKHYMLPQAAPISFMQTLPQNKTKKIRSN